MTVQLAIKYLNCKTCQKLDLCHIMNFSGLIHTRKQHCLMYPGTDFANFVQTLETLCYLWRCDAHEWLFENIMQQCRKRSHTFTQKWQDRVWEKASWYCEIIHTWVLGFIMSLKSQTLAGCLAIKEIKNIKNVLNKKKYGIVYLVHNLLF